MTHALGADLSSLQPDRLMTAAADETGLSDYGDDDLADALTRYLDLVVGEARLSPMGVVAQCANVHRLLVNRLRLVNDLRLHPEILDEVVSDPIVIIGLPRTGTTKLHRIMSSDPGVQATLLWRLLNPAPFPCSGGDSVDPRIAAAQQFEAFIASYHPSLMALHPFRAEEPEEEQMLCEGTFRAFGNGYRLRLPSWWPWWNSDSQQDVYAFLRLNLQYLQWQDGGRQSRPWVLKSPTHLGRLDVLRATFPAATIVHCHRDPEVVIASLCYLTELLRGTQTDALDLAEVGDTVLSVWSGQMEKNLTLRKHLGESSIVDVHYEDIRRHPFDAIRATHRAHAYTSAVTAEAHMAQWDQENPQHRFGRYAVLARALWAHPTTSQRRVRRLYRAVRSLGSINGHQSLRFLALVGATQVIFLSYNISLSWFALHNDPWPQDVQRRSYFTQRIAGPGTDYAPPGPGVPTPRRNSAHVSPDGRPVVPASE